MQLAVDGQLQVGSGRAFAPVKLAHDAAHGVDFDPFCTRTSAQHFLIAGFDADLADLETGDAQNRVRCFITRQIAFADRADVSHHMGKVAATGIDAGQADFGGDAGQGRGVYRDAADIIPCDTLGHGDGQEWRGAFHLCQGTVQFVFVQFHQRRQARDDVIDIARIFAHHGDAVGRFVGGDKHAIAVENLAALWRDQANVDPVFFGQEAKLVGLIDLQVLHSQTERAGKSQLHAAQDHAPTRDFADAIR